MICECNIKMKNIKIKDLQVFLFLFILFIFLRKWSKYSCILYIQGPLIILALCKCLTLLGHFYVENSTTQTQYCSVKLYITFR